MVSKRLNYKKQRTLIHLQGLQWNSYLEAFYKIIINSKLQYRSIVFSLIIVNLHYKSCCVIFLAELAMDQLSLIVNLVILIVSGS